MECAWVMIPSENPFKLDRMRSEARGVVSPDLDLLEYIGVWNLFLYVCLSCTHRTLAAVLETIRKTCGDVMRRALCYCTQHAYTYVTVTCHCDSTCPSALLFPPSPATIFNNYADKWKYSLMFSNLKLSPTIHQLHQVSHPQVHHSRSYGLHLAPGTKENLLIN
jgi:hypothetical protein